MIDAKMQVKINNTPYAIVELSRPHEEIGEEDVAFGVTVFSLGIIYLEKNLIKEVKRSTLIHELTHAHLMEYGMNHEHKTIEEVCDFMGAFADNIVAIADRYFTKVNKGGK